MIVRCGACRTQFEVQGAGRFACPACGSLNVVRGPAGAPPPAQQMPPGGYGPQGGVPAPPPPPPPEPPSPRISCPNCDFSFIVGRIETAPCPNCGEDVDTGWRDANGGSE